MININKSIAAGKDFLSRNTRNIKPAVIVGTSLILSGSNIVNQVNINSLPFNERTLDYAFGPPLIAVGYIALSSLFQRNSKGSLSSKTKSELPNQKKGLTPEEHGLLNETDFPGGDTALNIKIRELRAKYRGDIEALHDLDAYDPNLNSDFHQHVRQYRRALKMGDRIRERELEEWFKNRYPSEKF